MSPLLGLLLPVLLLLESVVFSLGAACSGPRSSSGLILALLTETAPPPPAPVPPIPAPPEPNWMLFCTLSIPFAIPCIMVLDPVPPVVDLVLVPPAAFDDPPRRYKSVIWRIG